MAHRGPSWPLAVLLLLCGAAGPAAPPPQARPAPSMAFYYGRDVPADLLTQFDRVVVEADEMDRASLQSLQQAHTVVFAYISVGEINRSRLLYSRVARSWVLGKSGSSDSDVLDLTQAEWRTLLIEQWMHPLWDLGYRGFFLDTLDSYQALVKDEAGRRRQVLALCDLVRAVTARFPGVQLIFNRGFELLPKVGGMAAGLVAESLFRGYDHDAGRYVELPEEGRSWLLARLAEARDSFHLPVTVIDYVPTAERELMRATARRISQLGFSPWVSSAGLDVLGVGAVEVVPRRVLALYNGAEQNDPHQVPDVAYTEVHRMGAMPLEYLGYAVDYADLRAPLPAYSLAGRYAGVVAWLSQGLGNPTAYRSFLQRQLRDGVPVAVLGELGFELTHEWQRRLGVQVPETHQGGAIRVVTADRMVGFEAPVHPALSAFEPLIADGPGVVRHLSLMDGEGNRMDAVFTAPWGGMARNPYVLQDGYRDSQRWILDPFEFYRQALRLTPIPVADVTTENGKRILLVHIDGDGFPSRAEMRKDDFAGKVILEQILKVYRVPTTVSVIEGEVGGKGKYPDLSPQLEAIARDIFRLPYVEVASHSFSHPFDWLRLGHDQADGDINGLFRYKFSLPREVDGSVDYIDQRLAPPGKKTRVYLWSGNALPPAEALALARSRGLYNLNGGDTLASRVRASLTNVSPMGRPIGGEYQVYAPVQNENIFTNEWRGPFYGFREVISTFQLTGAPRRLKPINIYYHFYSGSKIGSLKALKQVYDWALAQDVLPMYVSEYAPRVLGFQHLSLGRRLDGGWQLRSGGALRTLRLPPELPAPDLRGSHGVTGIFNGPAGRYVGLAGTGDQVLYLEGGAP